MPEPQWLPGPYAVEDDHRPGMAYNRHIVLDRDHDMRVCFMAHNGEVADNTFKSTARLLAAAPELYDALTAVSDMLFARPDMMRALQPLMGPAEHAVFALASVARAKARGES